MNLYSDISGRMEYIQKLFLNAAAKVEKIPSLNEIIAFLETEPAEFRSIAYESASMQIGLNDLSINQQLTRWIEFRETSGNQHAFHIDIGVGWAFARTGISPESYLSLMQPTVKWMAYDGMGYYYGLFKGRSTLKNKEIPGEVEGDNLHGFDQGLGRRLWYMAKGNVNELKKLVESFPPYRQPDLFQGIGIACGYVGGSKEDDLQYLREISHGNYKQLQLGIVLAAISRLASETISESINLACRVICHKTINEVRMMMTRMATNLFYLYNDSTNNSLWLEQLESELLQTNNASPLS